MRFPAIMLFTAAVFSGVSIAPVSAADPFASDWVASAKSRARLVANGSGEVGLEIELAPGAITYWRDPGESGVPPTFDFAGSRNLAAAQVLFPAPASIREPDGSTANGYREDIILPIRVSPEESGKPITVKLNANYAVCEKICLPARATLSLELPKGLSGPHGAALAAALSRVPRKTAFGDIGGALQEIDSSSWRLCFQTPRDERRELFLEAPSGVWLKTSAIQTEPGRECFLLSMQDAPASPSAPLPVVATLVGEQGAVETSFALTRP
jgi:DsbC/DsbD-like thiol-disulfide interchange protein